MKLLHSFPRPRGSSPDPTKSSNSRRSIPDDIAFFTLLSIIRNGLTCTPERLKLYSDRRTSNTNKLKLLRTNTPEYLHVQSRFCVTLCEEVELYQPKIRGLIPGNDGPMRSGNKDVSHADLFGVWAIAFEEQASRRIGFGPATYFVPSDLKGGMFRGGEGEPPGLGLQILHRLKEVREVLIIMAFVERGIQVDNIILPDLTILQALNLNIPFEQGIMKKIMAMSKKGRLGVFELFNTDREMAVNLVGFIDMLLSFFQQTDSSFDGEVLAFYQQREWRLIHHMRRGAVWYCLGCQPHFQNSTAATKQVEIDSLRRALSQSARRSEEYFKACWVLEEIDNQKVSHYIAEIIVPSHVQSEVRKAVREAGCSAPVVAAEEFGYNGQGPG